LQKLDDINKQEDARELLDYLLNAMHEADLQTGENKQTSLIQDLFDGAYQQGIKCANPNCGYVSYTIQPFRDLGIVLTGDDLLGGLKGLNREGDFPVVDQYHCGKYSPMS